MRGKEYVYPVQTKQMREKNEDPRVRVSEIIEGDKRLDGESYQEYKDRMKVETKLIRDYLKGYLIER
jgi:hypothetical protein